MLQVIRACPCRVCLGNTSSSCAPLQARGSCCSREMLRRRFLHLLWGGSAQESHSSLSPGRTTRGPCLPGHHLAGDVSLPRCCDGVCWVLGAPGAAALPSLFSSLFGSQLLSVTTDEGARVEPTEVPAADAGTQCSVPRGGLKELSGVLCAVSGSPTPPWVVTVGDPCPQQAGGAPSQRCRPSGSVPGGQ